MFSHRIQISLFIQWKISLNSSHCWNFVLGGFGPFSNDSHSGIFKFLIRMELCLAGNGAIWVPHIICLGIFPYKKHISYLFFYEIISVASLWKCLFHSFSSPIDSWFIKQPNVLIFFHRWISFKLIHLMTPCISWVHNFTLLVDCTCMWLGKISLYCPTYLFLWDYKTIWNYFILKKFYSGLAYWQELIVYIASIVMTSSA